MTAVRLLFVSESGDFTPVVCQVIRVILRPQRERKYQSESTTSRKLRVDASLLAAQLAVEAYCRLKARGLE